MISRPTIFRNLIYNYNWKINISRKKFGRLPQTSALSLCLVVTALFVTLCAPMGRPRLPASSTAAVMDASLRPATEMSPYDIPLLAYYYIWFDVESWERAKNDYPLLGRYSSDDAAVVRQHIQWAKDAGINGFIVSWKSTEKLNRRLDQLVEIAGQENFKLGIIYEGLDFNRNPLPAEHVDADLDYFLDHYAEHAAFELFEKPIVIWSGTWKFSVEEVRNIVQDKRERMFILASEKNVDGYQRLSGLVDGNAYYWSSVNPDSHSGYTEKLKAMSEAVHLAGGLWIAPAAPGFDARLVGGTSLVERKDGETLRTEMAAAIQSAPDAIGLISWNEFSENSHVEPSQKYGNRYLDLLAEIPRNSVPTVQEFPSSMPEN